MSERLGHDAKVATGFEIIEDSPLELVGVAPKAVFEIHLNDRVIKIYGNGRIEGLENYPGKQVIINRLPKGSALAMGDA
jgi:hypothetical protein